MGASSKWEFEAEPPAVAGGALGVGVAVGVGVEVGVASLFAANTAIQVQPEHQLKQKQLQLPQHHPLPQVVLPCSRYRCRYPLRSELVSIVNDIAAERRDETAASCV